MPIVDAEIPTDDPGSGGVDPGTGQVTAPGSLLFDIYVPKEEDESVLRLLAYCNVSSGDDLQFTAYLIVNGYLVQHCSVNLILDNQQSRARMPVTLSRFVDGLPAGNHRIQVSVRNFEPDSALTVEPNSTLEVTELKQASR